MDLAAVREFVGCDHGLAMVATTRGDGSVQATVVNAGVLTHPVTGDQVVGLVARGGSVKLDNLRARPRAAVTFRSAWEWVTVDGPVELCGPDDPLTGVDDDGLRSLLRDVFAAAGGTHDDFDEYDRVMAEERRCAVLVHPDRIYGVAHR